MSSSGRLSGSLVKYSNRAMFSPSPSQAQSAQHLHEDIFTQHVYLRKSQGGQCYIDFAFRDIEGAKIREPLVEAGKGKNTGRYIIETRMDELINGYDRRRAPVCFQRCPIYLFPTT
jgi:hypothetical protein